MFLEQTIQLQQWIESLQEPQRFFAYIEIFCGIPLLCIALWYIDKKIEEKKERI